MAEKRYRVKAPTGPDQTVYVECSHVNKNGKRCGKTILSLDLLCPFRPFRVLRDDERDREWFMQVMDRGDITVAVQKLGLRVGAGRIVPEPVAFSIGSIRRQTGIRCQLLKERRPGVLARRDWFWDPLEPQFTGVCERCGTRHTIVSYEIMCEARALEANAKRTVKP